MSSSPDRLPRLLDRTGAELQALVEGLPTPVHVLDMGALRNNLDRLDRVQREANCKILLALKGFATWASFPVIRDVLAGVAASSLHEAMLGRQEFSREVHSYAPAFHPAEVEAIAEISDHMVFNSPGQLRRHRERVRSVSSPPSLGLRINPEHREVATELYDPCAPRSRLGTRVEQLDDSQDILPLLSGLHFHNLCELGADALERTLVAVERGFSRYLSPKPDERNPLIDLRWINMGGGHHITRDGYDIDRLVRLVGDFAQRHRLDVYLEPGEAIGLNAGVLVARVLDLFSNAGNLAILDVSATAHMPDTLEMPYRPTIVGAGDPGEFDHTYRLGGTTCLAGDVIGDYSFPRPLEIGDALVFTDMAHYTIVKGTTFNGVRQPSLARYEADHGAIEVYKEFDYANYRDRLS